MRDKLPPLPPGLFPSGIGPYYRAEVVEQLRRDAYRQALEDAAQAMLAYGQQCRQQALEEAALACRYLRGFTYAQCDLFESAVLALKDKP